MTEGQLRCQIVVRCKELDARGLNRGASGNVSARIGDAMLITPSAVPYTELEPDMIALMPLMGDYGAWEGRLKPSTEWRFHLDLMRARVLTSALSSTLTPSSRRSCRSHANLSRPSIT